MNNNMKKRWRMNGPGRRTNDLRKRAENKTILIRQIYLRARSAEQPAASSESQIAKRETFGGFSSLPSPVCDWPGREVMIGTEPSKRTCWLDESHSNPYPQKANPVIVLQCNLSLFIYEPSAISDRAKDNGSRIVFWRTIAVRMDAEPWAFSRNELKFIGSPIWGMKETVTDRGCARRKKISVDFCITRTEPSELFLFSFFWSEEFALFLRKICETKNVSADGNLCEFCINSTFWEANK